MTSRALPYCSSCLNVFRRASTRLTTLANRLYTSRPPMATWRLLRSYSSTNPILTWYLYLAVFGTTGRQMCEQVEQWFIWITFPDVTQRDKWGETPLHVVSKVALSQIQVQVRFGMDSPFFFLWEFVSSGFSSNQSSGGE